jgi:hypothetical protein
VASQSPAPGAPIDAGAVTMLSLRRDAFGDGDLR